MSLQHCTARIKRGLSAVGGGSSPRHQPRCKLRKMFKSAMLILGAWLIISVTRAESYEGHGKTFRVLSNSKEVYENETTISWAKLNTSLVANNTTLDSFTICLRFRFRMFPNGDFETIYLGTNWMGPNTDWYNESLLVFVFGKPRSGFWINLGDFIWVFLKDSNLSQDRAYDLFVPNKWSHLCVAYASDKRMITFALVRSS